MAGLYKRRMVEIAVAVALTMAALLFVAWAAWAAGGISITGGFAGPTIAEGRPTAVYMTITNDGEEDDVLQAVRSPKAERVEVHQTKMGDDGIMRMRPVEDGLPIPAGDDVALAPGGYHVMVIGLSESLAEGDKLSLTLEFAKGRPGRDRGSGPQDRRRARSSLTRRGLTSSLSHL